MEQLAKIAAEQQGYFRTAQALEAGVTRRQLYWADRTATVENIRYGLYRFAHFPSTPFDELHEIQTLTPVATFSHETALQIYGLSSVLPRTIHVTVPPTSGCKPRPGLTLHHASIAADDRKLRDGMWVTSVARTLRDTARAGVDPDQLLEAARDAQRRGMLASDDLDRLRSRYPFSSLPRA